MIGEYEKSFPVAQEIDVTDPEWIAFFERLNNDDLYIKQKIEELDTLLDFERCPTQYLERLGILLSAGILKTDSDLLKRTKIRYAVQSHKFAGTFRLDVKPLIDALVKGDCYIYSNGHEYFGKWLLMSEPVPDYMDFPWGACFAHPLYETKLGMVFHPGSPAIPFVPGVILIDIDASAFSSQALGSVAYGNGVYVIAGASGTVLTSTDTITWTSQTSGTTKSLYGVTYGNGVYVTVGGNGNILTSADAITWTPQTSGTFFALYGVTYGNGVYVIAGASGTVLTSTDTITWTPQITSVTQTLNGVTYGGFEFAIVGDGGTFLTSLNGITWLPYIGKSGLDILEYEILKKIPAYMFVYLGTVISGDYNVYRILGYPTQK